MQNNISLDHHEFNYSYLFDDAHDIAIASSNETQSLSLVTQEIILNDSHSNST